jgi:hypothetical protein
MRAWGGRRASAVLCAHHDKYLVVTSCQRGADALEIRCENRSTTANASGTAAHRRNTRHIQLVAHVTAHELNDGFPPSIEHCPCGDQNHVIGARTR